MFILFLFAVIMLALLYCKQITDPITQDNIVPGTTILNYKFKYEKIGILPRPEPSTMFVCYSDTVFVYASYSMMTYNTITKSWHTTPYATNDSISGRFDGALAKFSDCLYVFGTPLYSAKANNYRVVKLNIPALTSELLPEPLPFKKGEGEGYPAYTEFNDKIIILYAHQDSVYLFDSRTEKSRFIAKNVFKTTPQTQFSEVPFAFGKFGDYLYVYEKTLYKLKRINLFTYIWEDVELPLEMKLALPSYKNANGAVFNGMLFLFNSDPKDALYYDFAKNSFGFNNLILTGDCFFESRFTNDSAFYFARPYPISDIWKITKQK